MERVHTANGERTVWTEKIILTMHELSGLKTKHLLAFLFVVAGILFTPTAAFWYWFEQLHTLDKLLTTRSCEGCDLSRVKLAGASLSGANLRHARLKSADLSVADLSHADLRHADLSGSTLYRANLSGADLQDANLSGADLLLANLSGATWVDGTRLKVLPRR